MEVNRKQCAAILTMWLENECAPEKAKILAKSIGYKDSPFFGAKKKKTKFIGELVLIHVALGIHAVNLVFNRDDAKSIIDPFLLFANKSIFSAIERQDPDFFKNYEKRMAQYFAILSQDNPGIGVSCAFLTNIDLDPLKNMKGQLFVSVKFGESLSKTVDVLKRMELAG
jgi:hypothetical protein